MALIVKLLLLILQVQSLPKSSPFGPLYSPIKQALNKAKSNAGLVPTYMLLGHAFVALSHSKFMRIKLGYRIMNEYINFQYTQQIARF